MSLELKTHPRGRRMLTVAMFLACFACSGGLAAPARAEIPTFDVNPDSDLEVSPRAEHLADPRRTGDTRRMLAPETRFEPPLGVTPNFGVDSTLRWYRFALRNTSATERLNVYIDVGYPGLDRVTLHHVELGELVSEETGNDLPFSQKPIPFPTFLYRVTLEPSEVRPFVLEIESQSIHSVTVTVSGEDAFIDGSRRRFLLQGIFYGLLVMLALQHAFAFITQRSRADFWYVIHSVSALLYVAAILGALYERWPDAVVFNSIAPLYFIGVLAFATGRFGVVYLAPRGWARHLTNGFSYAVLLALLTAYWVDLNRVVFVYFIGVMVLGGTLMTVALRRTMAGSRAAAAYLVAWAPSFVVGLVFSLSTLGVLPWFHLGPYMIGAALLWERVVVSTSLQRRVSEALKSEIRLREEALVAAERQRKLESERQRGRRLESLGRLAGGIAHDFNNLLQAIGGYLHILGKKETLSEEGGAHLRQAKTSVQRAAALTRKLLVLGQNTPTGDAAVTVDQTIADLEQLLTRMIPSDVSLELDLRAEDAAVACDRAQFELCITNLALNARDAMPLGGTITISTRIVGEEVCVTVADTGKGIQKEHLDRIFDPFFTTKDVGEGTGLGLVMAHSIVTGAKGTLRVESAVGVGTRFFIDLPIASTAPTPEVAEAAPAAPAGGSERILLVDDAEDVRAVGDAILGDAGYEVRGAVDGVDAIEVIRSSPPFDLVVMDVVMPRMGGAELYEWLERHHPEMPVLVCTAHRPDEAADRLDRARLPLLRKPYEADELLAAVRALLDLKRGDERAQPEPRRE